MVSQKSKSSSTKKLLTRKEQKELWDKRKRIAKIALGTAAIGTVAVAAYKVNKNDAFDNYKWYDPRKYLVASIVYPTWWFFDGFVRNK